MTKELFKNGDPQTNGLANRQDQYIDIYHLPTKNSVKFKAYVTAFSDQYTSDWNSETVFGRMDPIQTFKSTSRKISLGWDVPASSFEEAKENMRKASLLLKMLYPEYEDGSGGATLMKSPPMLKIKFLNLIQDSSAPEANSGNAQTAGLLGTVGGFTFEPDLDMGFFQPTSKATGIDSADNHKLFPKTLKFSADFTVLHQHELGWKGYKTQNSSQMPPSFDAFPYGVRSGVKPPLNVAPGNPDITVNNADGSVNVAATNEANKGKVNQSYEQRQSLATAETLGGE